jgi:hypothetical protein
MQYPALCDIKSRFRYPADEENAARTATKTPHKYKESVLFSHGMRNFLAVELLSGKVMVCCIDNYFKRTFIGGNTLKDALSTWYENFEQTGDGL